MMSASLAVYLPPFQLGFKIFNLLINNLCGTLIIPKSEEGKLEQKRVSDEHRFLRLNGDPA